VEIEWYRVKITQKCGFMKYRASPAKSGKIPTANNI
jgi:hypothetical protein